MFISQNIIDIYRSIIIHTMMKYIYFISINLDEVGFWEYLLFGIYTRTIYSSRKISFDYYWDFNIKKFIRSY